ncbi:alpha-galactosidase [Flammeovirga yaeyamensis]|uniref:Alpha-galactosidase n=1 Tax=Flammeovirga yaeyamensis TaxID=367791 RepID=A0AAX1NBZ0_9BACT|nr:alpha-galactosidase [Flammeovirga yaeyamensis]MBB3697003.1 alpha-galactosidase [Flammeovirga yaeyamensis]NMF33666.1 hypothetical protein [Flammeovirga yaeyamensis]QWG05068.1 alpha-galactosidase [Flammeovirga yaeyamensis]
MTGINQQVKGFGVILFYCLSSLSLFMACNTKMNTEQQLKGINNTSINAPLTTTVDVKDGGSKKWIELNIFNNTDKEQVVENVSFNLDIDGKISKDAQIMMGSSDMGRLPTQIFNNKNKIDYHSKNFVMVKEGDKYLLAGLLSWNIFLPEFTIVDDNILVSAKGDGKIIPANKSIDFEKIVVLKGNNWATLLDEYGQLIYDENAKRKKKDDVVWKGWATWDYYVRDFTSKDVDDNIVALNELKTNANIIQLDGGWWPQRGDYDMTKEGYNMKEVVDNIVENGYSVGLHFDGFRGDIRSKVYKEHPEYFLKDFDGTTRVHTSIRGNGDTLACNFFDYSNPEARTYIQKMIKNMRDEWKVEYFKVDFMRFGLEPGVPYVKGTTPAERFKLGVTAIREAIGEENYFLGCSAVFGPTFGEIDGLRTGGDIFPTYKAVPERAVANLGNSYLHGNVLNADADYIILRESHEEDETITVDPHKHSDLNKAETIIWSKFSSLFGSSRIDSDKVGILGDDKKNILPSLFELPKMSKIIAVDTWEHYTNRHDAPQIVVSETDKKSYISIFNWGDQSQNYTIEGIQSGTAKPLFKTNNIDIQNGKLEVNIDSKDCLILELDKKENILEFINNLKYSTYYVM